MFPDDLPYVIVAHINAINANDLQTYLATYTQEGWFDSPVGRMYGVEAIGELMEMTFAQTSPSTMIYRDHAICKQSGPEELDVIEIIEHLEGTREDSDMVGGQDGAVAIESGERMEVAVKITRRIAMEVPEDAMDDEDGPAGYIDVELVLYFVLLDNVIYSCETFILKEGQVIDLANRATYEW